MGCRVALMLACALSSGCGRINFDVAGEGNGSGDGGLPPVAPWAALFGGGPDGTSIARVVEDDAGDLWIVGSSFAFGPEYVDGWMGKLDGSTGALLFGGVRTFQGSEQTVISSAHITVDQLFVVGSKYTDTDQQHTFGAFALDGSWRSSQRMGGGLADPGESDVLSDLVPTADGGYIIVGSTRIGTGGCGPSCHGTDALVVKLRADGTVEWTRAIGEALGDEAYERVIALPGGDVIAFGGGGAYDFSGGAGTNIDAGPSLISRIGGDGTIRWSRRIKTSAVGRGSALTDGVLDPQNGELIVVGAQDYGDTPIIAHVTQDGAVTRIHEVILDGFPGRVTAVQLADDGGLFIAGFEEVPPINLDRSAYVARTNATRDGIVWARRVALAYASDDWVRLLRSRRGDLVLWSTGTGADLTRAVVVRIGADGEGASCWPLAPASMTFAAVTDASIDVNLVTTPISAVGETLTGGAIPLPGQPATSCP